VSACFRQKRTSGRRWPSAGHQAAPISAKRSLGFRPAQISDSRAGRIGGFARLIEKTR
jgi:hypothetical protein